jgi:hypothetical protein
MVTTATTLRKRTRSIIIFLTLTSLLILSATVSSSSSSSLIPVQAQQQKETPSTVNDIFKIIVTLFGIDRNIGDVVTFVNVNNITQSKVYNPLKEKFLSTNGHNGTSEVAFTFPNETINEGTKFTVCNMIVQELSIICQEGTNSPAARPEIVDLELDSAQFLKVGEPEVEKVKEKTVIVEEADNVSNEVGDEQKTVAAEEADNESNEVGDENEDVEDV